MRSLIRFQSYLIRLKRALELQTNHPNGLQAGFSAIIALIVTGIITILGLIVTFVYVLPQVYVQTANMSQKLVTAGASSDSAQWWVWIMWSLIVLTIVGIGLAIVKQKRGHIL